MRNNYDSKRRMLKYDIVLNMPHSDYFVDVELKHDFLTARFQAFLFA